MKQSWLGVVVGVGLVLTGCGAGEVNGPLPQENPQNQNPDPNQNPEEKKNLLPLTVGNRWEYKVTDTSTGTSVTKVTTVSKKEPLPGAASPLEVFVLESVSGSARSVIYIQGKDDMAVRHREEEYRQGALTEWKSFSPFALRGPVAMLNLGQVIRDAFTEEIHNPDGSVKKTKAEDFSWNVVSVDEKVSVPAGNFTTVHIKRLKTTNLKEKHTWWAPGVGKVKELDVETEELLSYQLK